MDPLKTLLDAKANAQGMAPHVSPPDRLPPGPRPIDPGVVPGPTPLPHQYQQWQPPKPPADGTPHQIPPGTEDRGITGPPTGWTQFGTPPATPPPDPSGHQPFDFENVPPPDPNLVGPLDERMSWLLGPTQRPEEPVTAGHPVGPGAGFVIRPSETIDQFRNRVASVLDSVPFFRDDPNMQMYLNRLRRGF